MFASCDESGSLAIVWSRLPRTRFLAFKDMHLTKSRGVVTACTFIAMMMWMQKRMCGKGKNCEGKREKFHSIQCRMLKKRVNSCVTRRDQREPGQVKVNVANIRRSPMANSVGRHVKASVVYLCAVYLFAPLLNVSSSS